MCSLFAGNLYHRPAGVDLDFSLPMSRLDAVVETGPTHGTIGHVQGGSTNRGAFVMDPIAPRDVPLYPSLWSAGASAKQHMVVAPTHQGIPIAGRNVELNRVLETRSDIFISQDFRFTSQSLGVARTRELCLGIATWVALIHDDHRILDALALWMNSTLGLVLRFAYASTAQLGRARMAIEATRAFPIPNFAEDSDAGERSRLVAGEHFEQLATLELEPAAYAWRDANRHEIDWVVLEMLGIDSDEARRAVGQIRELWCREPSVHGDNKRIMKALGITE